MALYVGHRVQAILIAVKANGRSIKYNLHDALVAKQTHSVSKNNNVDSKITRMASI